MLARSRGLVEATKLSFKCLSVQDFIKHLTLKRVEDNDHSAVLFAESNMNFGWGRLFGGQPMSQAVSAAAATVPVNQLVHSFSCNFLREGMMDSVVEFHVEKLRDGKSFASRRVRAVQPHGDILDMILSFHVEEEGWDHQLRTPPFDSTDPDTLGPNAPRVESFAKSLGKTVDQVLPKVLQDIYLNETQPMLMRPSLLLDMTAHSTALPPHQRNWIKANTSEAIDLDTIDFDDEHAVLSEAQLSQVMLAFVADFSFLGTSLLPHGTTVWNPKVQPASLSHTMYFHRKFSIQDWLVFEMESPSASGARGFVRGEIFDVNSGVLIASAMQEGLIRPRKFRKPNSASFFS